jgi:glycerol-3-phosphate acyltransferase PlsY
MKTVLCLLLGYLLGSVPFALVIGRLFYHTDLRKHGSGNLGGTNAGRVLGKKAGAAVIVLDVLKVVISMWLASFVSADTAIWTGLACCIGHCYPVFARFKGGKAVSTVFGFLLGISLFVFKSPAFFLAPFVMFFIILYLFKYVSLASITGILCSSLLITSLEWGQNWSVILASWCMSALVIWRHQANIERIRKGSENAIKWM